jgi:hypothetical protein
LLTASDRGSVDLDLDLDLGGASQPAPRFVDEILIREEIVWIAAASNPIGQEPFDARALDGLQQVLISIWRPRESPLVQSPENQIAIFPRLMIEPKRGPETVRSESSIPRPRSPSLQALTRSRPSPDGSPCRPRRSAESRSFRPRSRASAHDAVP